MINIDDKIKLLKVFFTSDEVSNKDFPKYAKKHRDIIVKKKALVKFRDDIKED